MLCGALDTHLMARGVYVAGLLKLSLLKPLGSPGEGDLAPRSSWQGSRKAEWCFCRRELPPFFGCCRGDFPR